MNGASASFQNAIVRITETVSNYRDGLARIDREFDEAFDRIDRSIAGLYGDKTKHGKRSEKAQDQEKETSSGVKQDRTCNCKGRRRDKRGEPGDSAVEAEIRELGNDKHDLERQISDRWLIEKIYYFFVATDDEAKKRCRTLQRQLDSAANRKSALEQTKRDFEAMRKQAEARIAELQVALLEIRRKIVALEKTKGLNEEQARHLAHERQQANTNQEKRKASWLSVFANEWKKTTAEIEHGFLRLRRQQPSFVDLFKGNIPVAPEAPTGLVLGSQTVSFRSMPALSRISSRSRFSAP